MTMKQAGIEIESINESVIIIIIIIIIVIIIAQIELKNITQLASRDP